MSGKLPVQTAKKMTLQELEGPAPTVKGQAKMGYSAFSTAVHQDRGSTNEKTYDSSQFKKSEVQSPLEKNRISLKLFSKQKSPAFKEATYVIPDLDGDQNEKQDLKQNNRRFLNTVARESNAEEKKKSIPWGSVTKIQTAEIVRNLFGGKRVDYNLQYRKKKFFEHFANQL